MDPYGPIARRFPLVARSRPGCAPIGARVGELCALADTARREDDLAAASAVWNQAALLASDLGLPELAREWCHRHIRVYLPACPLNARMARHALEPLVNLARLYIRAGEGDQALRLLSALFAAVTSGTDTTIDGLSVPAATLTETADDHQELRQWLWTVLLRDGTRALTSACRWQDALAHLERNKGIGSRMFDGRQAAIIARATTGEADDALAMLADTAPGDPWENAVTACLTLLCRRDSDKPSGRDEIVMLDRYQQLDLPPGFAVFHTRLGLTVIDAIGGVEKARGLQVAADLIQRVATVGDGYAAREVLAHDGCAATLTAEQARDLTGVLTASALGRQELPAALGAQLSVALSTSEAVLSRGLAARSVNPAV